MIKNTSSRVLGFQNYWTKWVLYWLVSKHHQRWRTFDFLGPSTIDLCTSQSLVGFQGPTFWLSNVETVPVFCVNIDLIALLSGFDDVRTTGAEWRSNDVWLRAHTHYSPVLSAECSQSHQQAEPCCSFAEALSTLTARPSFWTYPFITDSSFVRQNSTSK